MDRYLARLQREIESATVGLSSEQLLWHPESKWCAAEVLEHLYLTYAGTIKGFGRVIEAGKSLARRATLKDRVRAMVVIEFGYVPAGREAPPHSRPRGLPAETVLTGIGPKLVEMDNVIDQCDAKLGSQEKVLDHPFLGPLSVGQWRKFHLVHGLHHIKQIRRLRQNMNGNRSAGA
jgi:hypothetical protein